MPIERTPLAVEAEKLRAYISCIRFSEDRHNPSHVAELKRIIDKTYKQIERYQRGIAS